MSHKSAYREKLVEPEIKKERGVPENFLLRLVAAIYLISIATTGIGWLVNRNDFWSNSFWYSLGSPIILLAVCLPLIFIVGTIFHIIYFIIKGEISDI